MSGKTDWSKAPEWATRLMRNRTTLLVKDAWASDPVFGKARGLLVAENPGEEFMLMEDCWVLLERRRIPGEYNVPDDKVELISEEAVPPAEPNLEDRLVEEVAQMVNTQMAGFKEGFRAAFTEMITVALKVEINAAIDKSLRDLGLSRKEGGK